MLRTEPERRAAAERGRPGGQPPSRGRHRRSRWRVWRRRLAVLVILALIPVGWSWGHAVTAPGNGGVGVSSVEWIRSHGGGWLVAGVENFWYRLHAPPRGGKPPPGYIQPSKPAPRVRTASPPATAHHATGPPHLPAPKPIPTIAKPALAGEGVWHPSGRKVDGLPAVYVADIRPDTVHTSLVTGVAWMDPKLLTAKMFAGSEEPGGGPWPYSSPIPPSMRKTLVATFNSGFKMQDAHGGYYAYGKLAQPLVKGAASFVIYKNGTVNVGSWGSEVRMTPQVAAVRQNLTLIIDRGHMVPGLATSNFDHWGATVDNQVLVWRSGVGVTANGALLYAAGNGLSVSSLANVLLHAGAVRAMEMDINYEWTTFSTFDPAPGQPAGPANAKRLLPDMDHGGERYFQPYARDFIAMFARHSHKVSRG
jgi:hypothetical protein